MDIRVQLHNALNDGVPEVGTRVYPLILVQDTKENAIVYTMIGNIERTGVSCNAPLFMNHNVQVDVFCKTYAEMVAIGKKTLEALRAAFKISGVMTYELYEEHTLKYRMVIDFRLNVTSP